MRALVLVLCLVASSTQAADINIILSDADQQQLFNDDLMMDQCVLHGGGRCVRIQQLLLIRIQEALKRQATGPSPQEPPR